MFPLVFTVILLLLCISKTIVLGTPKIPHKSCSAMFENIFMDISIFLLTFRDTMCYIIITKTTLRKEVVQMANIGYIRVSTTHQNTDRQHELFNTKGIVLDKVFEEKISGKNTNRPALQSMLEYIRCGDTVFVESYSRLARSTSDLIYLVTTLKDKGVNFVSLKENVDTSTPAGQLVFTIFAGLAQFERETIKERQREGIDLALKEGRAYGRPAAVISDTFTEHYQQWKSGNIKAVDFMRIENIPHSTFYKLVKRYEKANNITE